MEKEETITIDGKLRLNPATWDVEVLDPEGLRFKHLRSGAEALGAWIPKLRALIPMAVEAGLEELPMERLPLDWHASIDNLTRNLREEEDIQRSYDHLNELYCVERFFFVGQHRYADGLGINPDTGQVVVWLEWGSTSHHDDWVAYPGETWYYTGTADGYRCLPDWVEERVPERTLGEELVVATMHNVESQEMDGYPRDVREAFREESGYLGCTVQEEGERLVAYRNEQPVAFVEGDRVYPTDLNPARAFPKEPLYSVPTPTLGDRDDSLSERARPVHPGEEPSL